MRTSLTMSLALLSEPLALGHPVREPEHPSPYMLVSTAMLASRKTSRIEWRIVLVGRSFAERLSQCHYRHGTSVSQ